MLRLRSIVTASGILFFAVFGFVLSTSNDAPVATRRATTADVLAPPLVPPAALVRPDFTPRAAAGADDAWSQDDAPSKVARRLRDARDKREFFDHAVKVGGGAHLAFALEALHRCAKVNQLGMVGAEQDMVTRMWVNDPARERRLAAYRAFIRGCEGFEMRRVSRQESLELDRRVYEADDPMGRASNLVAYPDTAESYEKQSATARELLETRDPYILKLVAPYLAGRRAGNLTWDRFVEGGPAADAFQREVNAWNVALCELGMDCDPSGPYGPVPCFALGKCERTSVEEIVPFIAPGGPLAPVPGRKDEIVAAVRAGDWEKLGL